MLYPWILLAYWKWFWNGSTQAGLCAIDAKTLKHGVDTHYLLLEFLECWADGGYYLFIYAMYQSQRGKTFSCFVTILWTQKGCLLCELDCRHVYIRCLLSLPNIKIFIGPVAWPCNAISRHVCSQVIDQYLLKKCTGEMHLLLFFVNQCLVGSVVVTWDWDWQSIFHS